MRGESVAPDWAGRSHRHDLDGLRGVAILLVALYHVFAGRVSGGVDVFLTLSGFFLVLSLTSRIGRLDDDRFGTMLRGLGAAWLRIARRLLPAAVVTLAGTWVAVRMFLPRTQWEETARQTLAALFYVENWHLIANEHDYDAAGLAVSPLQHFWSLSVQGQFFLIVPAAVLLFVWAQRRLLVSGSQTWGLFSALGVTAVLSFGYAVWSVERDQAVAYYDTWARGWEIVVGGLVALLLPVVAGHAVRAGARFRTLVGWLALGMIVSCGFLLDGGSLFPGWATWWPVGATLLLVWAGAVPTRYGADRVLASRPARWLGDHAYSLYLWHWPVLIVYLGYRGQDDLAWPGGTAVLATSLVLAVVTKRLVEDPLRGPLRAGMLAPVSRLTRPRIVAATTAFVVAFGVSVSGTQAYVRDVERLEAMLQTDGMFVTPDHVGALALLEPEVDAVGGEAEIFPAPAQALADRAESPYRCDAAYGKWRDRQPNRCVIHQSDGGPEVAIVGGSHESQLIPAFRLMAEVRGFTLVGYWAHGCAWMLDPNVDEDDEFAVECRRYNQDLTERVISDRPDLVVATGTRNALPRAEAGDTVPARYVAPREAVAEAGIAMLLLRDNPRLLVDVPQCVERQRTEDRDVVNAQCGISRSKVFTDPMPTVDLPHTTWVDLGDAYCRMDWCNVVEGNVLMYRDKGHITATYMRTLAPEIDRQMGEATGWWVGPLNP